MQNKTKKIMILGAGEMQVPVIRKAKQSGYYTIVVDFDKFAPGFMYAAKKLIISTHNKNEILKEAEKNKIDGILTTSDFPVRVVAFVAKKLNLNALSIEAAALCTDKYLLREKLVNSDLFYPKYFLVEKKEDLNKVNFFPAVIKPVDSSASRGVKRVNNLTELHSEYENSKKYSQSGKIIAEEFISGKEFSVEAVTYKGKTEIIAITEKTKTGEGNGYFVEFRHIIPANITDREKEIIGETSKRLIKYIKLDNSVSHTEIILSENKAYIVEIGARPGGDFIASDLVSISCGVNMMKTCIDISLYQDIEVNRKFEKYSAVQFLIPDNYKTAKRFIGKEKNKIVRYEILPYKNIEIKNSTDRLGYIIISAGTKSEINNLISEINNEN